MPFQYNLLSLVYWMEYASKAIKQWCVAKRKIFLLNIPKKKISPWDTYICDRHCAKCFSLIWLYKHLMRWALYCRCGNRHRAVNNMPVSNSEGRSWNRTTCLTPKLGSQPLFHAHFVASTGGPDSVQKIGWHDFYMYIFTYIMYFLEIYMNLLEIGKKDT